MNLKKKISNNYESYLKGGFDRNELLSILGDRFIFEYKSIQEILDYELMVICQNKQDWFFKSVKNLNIWIERAFYSGQYSIDNINMFFNEIYTEQDLINSSKKTETDYDDMFDLYVKVLKELNYDL